jgi:hypothetical protein
VSHPRPGRRLPTPALPLPALPLAPTTTKSPTSAPAASPPPTSRIPPIMLPQLILSRLLQYLIRHPQVLDRIPSDIHFRHSPKRFSIFRRTNHLLQVHIHPRVTLHQMPIVRLSTLQFNQLQRTTRRVSEDNETSILTNEETNPVTQKRSRHVPPGAPGPLSAVPAVTYILLL